MAAKKAPAKKPPTPKKTGGNTGSANAAENRAARNRYMSKKVSVNDSTLSGYSEGTDNPVRGGKKTGMDARKRDSKYGKPTGPTTVQGYAPGRISQKQFTQTLVTSKKGNKYVVTREKTKRRFLPDTNSKADVSPYQAPRKTRTRTQTVRSRQGRALMAAKTPTKRSAAKKRYN